jgi:hypothetical protein
MVPSVLIMHYRTWFLCLLPVGNCFCSLACTQSMLSVSVGVITEKTAGALHTAFFAIDGHSSEHAEHVLP